MRRSTMDSNSWTYQNWLTVKIYIYQLCADTGCRQKDSIGAMAGWRESERERERDRERERERER